MPTWSKNRVNSANINGGNEYSLGSSVSLNQLNAMVNSGLYSQDVVERLTNGGDYSAGTTYIYPNIVRYATDGCAYMAVYKVGADYTSFSGVAPTNTTYWKKLVDKGETGATGASIISAEFDGDDIKFTKSDASEVILEDAKLTLKGEQGIQGAPSDRDFTALSNSMNTKTGRKVFSPKSWNGLTSFRGNYVWTDGTNIYYSNGASQYVLDTATSTWSNKTWNGLTSFLGNYVWTDGTNIYYSNGASQYVLTSFSTKPKLM